MYVYVYVFVDHQCAVMDSCTKLKIFLEKGEIDEIKHLELSCREKMVVLNTRAREVDLRKDPFSTATITEKIKNVVLGEMDRPPNKTVVAARYVHFYYQFNTLCMRMPF